jgi:hypothetical protein
VRAPRPRVEVVDFFVSGNVQRLDLVTERVHLSIRHAGLLQLFLVDHLPYGGTREDLLVGAVQRFHEPRLLSFREGEGRLEVGVREHKVDGVLSGSLRLCAPDWLAVRCWRQRERRHRARGRCGVAGPAPLNARRGLCRAGERTRDEN